MSTNKLAHKLACFKDTLTISVSMQEEAERLNNEEELALTHYLLVEGAEQIHSQYYYLKEVLRVNRSLQKKLQEERIKNDELSRKLGGAF